MIALVSLAVALASMFGRWDDPHGPDRKDEK